MQGMIFKPFKAKLIVDMKVGETVVDRRTDQLKEINNSKYQYEVCKHEGEYTHAMNGGFQFMMNPLYKHPRNLIAVKPRYHVGQVVYVREAWDSDCTCGNPYCNGVIFKAGYAGKIVPDKWRSPLHLKAIHARSFLKVLSVDAGRVKDITPEDCLKEGIHSIVFPANTWTWDDSHVFNTPQEAYFALFDSINGEGAHLNHWAFRYLLEKVERT